jgi:hypothetical protein
MASLPRLEKPADVDHSDWHALFWLGAGAFAAALGIFGTAVWIGLGAIAWPLLIVGMPVGALVVAIGAMREYHQKHAK